MLQGRVFAGRGGGAALQSAHHSSVLARLDGGLRRMQGVLAQHCLEIERRRIRKLRFPSSRGAVLILFIQARGIFLDAGICLDALSNSPCVKTHQCLCPCAQNTAARAAESGGVIGVSLVESWGAIHRHARRRRMALAASAPSGLASVSAIWNAEVASVFHCAVRVLRHFFAP